MQLTLAYCDIPGYEYDAPGAINKKYMNVFTLEVSDLTPVSNIDSKRFEVELLDGQKWLLPRKHRLQQAFTTLPNLVLQGQSMSLVSWDDINLKPVFGATANYTIADLLTNWLYARSQWIATPDMEDVTEKKYGLVKVIPKSDKIGSKHDEIGIMPITTIDFETAGAFTAKDTVATAGFQTINPIN